MDNQQGTHLAAVAIEIGIENPERRTRGNADGTPRCSKSRSSKAQIAQAAQALGFAERNLFFRTRDTVQKAWTKEAQARGQAFQSVGIDFKDDAFRSWFSLDSDRSP